MKNPLRTIRQRTALTSGFTLVELMIVVAMVGVLATLAIVGYRRYIDSSKVSEAVYVIGGIRSAEESIRAETMVYLNVSSSGGGYYPRKDLFDSKKVSWDNPNHEDVQAWRALNVTVDGPVRFGYQVVAGAAGSNVSITTKYSPQPTWPSTTTEPWYVTEAVGDPGERKVTTSVLGCSFTNEIFMQNE